MGCQKPSNHAWYIDGDNKNGESALAGKQFFSSDSEFRPAEFMHFCSKMLVKEPKEAGKSPLHDTVLRVRTTVQIHRVRTQIRVKSLHTAGFPQGLLGASVESKHEGRRQLRIRSYPLSGQVAQIQQQRENDFQLLRLGEGQHHAQMPPLPETCPASQTVDRDIHGQGRCCH